MGTVHSISDMTWGVALSHATSEKLQAIVNDLRQFEVAGKAAMPTPAQSLAALLAIAGDAQSIVDKLKALSAGDVLSLDRWLATTSWVPDEARNAEGITDLLGGHAAYAQCMAQNLSKAISSLTEEMATTKGLRGRKPVQRAYAGYVASIAHAVMNDGIKPSRSGDFKTITNKIFDTASVHSKPDGPIRFYIESGWAEKHRTQGLCL